MVCGLRGGDYDQLLHNILQINRYPPLNVATLFRFININWQTSETALSRVHPLKQ